MREWLVPGQFQCGFQLAFPSIVLDPGLLFDGLAFGLDRSGSGSYPAFVFDLDGNNIEAVFREDEE